MSLTQITGYREELELVVSMYALLSLFSLHNPRQRISTRTTRHISSKFPEPPLIRARRNRSVSPPLSEEEASGEPPLNLKARLR